MANPEDTRLVLDVMVGGLRVVLRMCGYDTAYALERGIEADQALIDLARREGRTIITRDSEIAARFDGAVLLTATDTHEQLRELRSAGFALELAEPGRCSRCNGTLERVHKGSGPEDGPDPEAEPVWQCQECGHHYWKGSHWDDIKERLENT